MQNIRVKKADQSKVLSKEKIEAALRKTMDEEGDIYDKAAVLLTELARGHAFASGVRRTAYAATVSFLKVNGEDTSILHDPKVLMGIRERFYSKEEVKSWLKGNEVRKFTRD